MRGEKIYEYVIDITGMTDFGASMEDLLTGKAPFPPGGARFDFTFDGRVSGRIVGRIHGIDYYRLRPDGGGELDIRGVIETDDGHRISIFADGTASPHAGGAGMDLFETVRLVTSAADYAWVNGRSIWAVGASADGKIHVEAYLQ